MKKSTSLYKKIFAYFSRSFWLSFYYGFARYLPVSYRYGWIGKLAKSLRGYACGHIFLAAGRNINIEQSADFGNGQELEIGDYSGIGINCLVPANIKIGNDVMMGPEVMMFGVNHNFDNLDKPMRLQGGKLANPIVIDDDVWIGARVIILPGVNIGKGAVIGAGAVVTKDVPPFTICAGNPARVIRRRLETKTTSAINANLQGRPYQTIELPCPIGDICPHPSH